MFYTVNLQDFNFASQFKWPLAVMWWCVSLWELRVYRFGILTWETGKQRNSYKVRVGAFSAISVLFEFRWVMWSCCLSAPLSLRHPFLLFFFFTLNCQMSPTVRSKSFYLRCCFKSFPKIICISAKPYRCLAKYTPRL